MTDISSADDNTVSVTQAQNATRDIVQDVPTTTGATDPQRVTQQILIPTAVQSRALGNLFSIAPDNGEVFFGEFPQLFDGASISFVTTVADPQNRSLLAVPEVSFFVNGQAYPNQDFGFGNCPVFVYYDLGLSDGSNLVLRTAMENSSGKTIDSSVRVRFRIIANPTQAQVTG